MPEMRRARQASHWEELLRLTSSMPRSMVPRQLEQSANAG
jgi:hypothetical protein